MKSKYVDSALELDRDRLLVADGRSPIIVGFLKNLERPAGRLAGANHDVDVDRLALFDVGRNRDLFDQHLPVVEVVDRQDVDLYAQRLGGERLLEEVATILVAIREQDDARAVSSGNDASASLTAAARSVFSGSIVVSIPSKLSSLGAGGISTRGSLPKTTTPARSSLRRFFEASFA